MKTVETPKYLVSIITPVYNSRKYLRGTFLSVKRQTIGFKNIEYILVDDGSDDGSFELIERFAARYSNVKAYKTLKNSGSASKPRDIALDAVTSDYIMFLDADDVLEHGAVEYLYGAMTSRDVDLVGGAYRELNDKRSPFDKRYENSFSGYYDFRLDMQGWFPIMHPFFTKLFKTEIIRKHNIYFDTELSNGEDTLFIIEYMKHTKNAWHENRLVYFYRVRDNSMSHKYKKQYFLGMLKTCKKIKDTLAETKLLAIYDMFLEATAAAFMDQLCDCDSFKEQEYVEILEQWFPVLKYVGEKGIPTDTAIGTILVDDAKKDDFEAAKFHFFEIHRTYKLHKTKLTDIFNSRAWKFMATLNKFLGR